MREVPTSKIPSDFKFHTEDETHSFVDELHDALNPKKDKEENIIVSNLSLHDHDFHTQPTNIEAEVTVEDEGRKVQINKEVAEEGVYKMKSQLDREEVVVPFALQKYIESLIKSGRALRSFKEFYFDSQKTKSKWKDILARYHDSGGFSNDEYTKALKLLDGEEETEFTVEKEGKINLKIERRVESVEENLEKARGKYVAHYVEWKNKNRTKKIKYARVLSDLGVDKQLPIHEEPKDLIESREYWLSARKAKSDTQVRKLDFLESEYDLVSSLIKTSLPPKERGAFEKSQVGWNKLSPAQKLSMSVSILTSGTTFGNLGLSSVGTFSGFRSPKAEIQRFATNPEGRSVDGIFKKGKEEQLVSLINEDRLAMRDAAFVKAIEEETDESKKRILMKAADLVRKVVDIVPQVSIKPTELRLSSPDFASGLRYLKERITEQYENGRVPQVVRENIIEKKDEEIAREFGFRVSNENVVGTFAGEIFSLDEKGNISIRHLDGSKDTIINTLAQVKVKHVPKIEIPEPKIEKVQEKFIPKQDGLENRMGTTPIAIPFEGGKIYVTVSEEGESPTIHVSFNDKEIARGKFSKKGPKVELIDAPGVKSGFFFADTVYERAFKQVKSIIKKLKPVEESQLKTVI